MKTFDDLKFGPHPANEYATFRPPGVQAVITFSNGWGVSVVQSSGSGGMGDLYGSAQDGTYELAVLGPDGDLHYHNPVARGDVCAWLSVGEVNAAMANVQNFPPENERVPAEWREFSPRHYDQEFPRPVLAI